MPVRLPAIREPRSAWQVAPPVARPEPQPADPTQDPRLAHLPTEQEIAAEVRRRPVGAVIVDICRDLGITPGQFDRASWDELCHAITGYGGNIAGFLVNLNKRLFTFAPDDCPDPADPLWPAAPLRFFAPATGPP